MGTTDTSLFADQQVELLPPRTTLRRGGGGRGGHGGGITINIVVVKQGDFGVVNIFQR
jgi:hypothetical protein